MDDSWSLVFGYPLDPSDYQRVGDEMHFEVPTRGEAMLIRQVAIIPLVVALVPVVLAIMNWRQTMREPWTFFIGMLIFVALPVLLAHYLAKSCAASPMLIRVDPKARRLAIEHRGFGVVGHRRGTYDFRLLRVEAAPGVSGKLFWLPRRFVVTLVGMQKSVKVGGYESRVEADTAAAAIRQQFAALDCDSSTHSKG